MPKFNVEVTFSLETTIEPDYVSFEEPDDAEDFEDNSSFRYGGDIEVDGGNVTFTVEAEDEYEAEQKAQYVYSDGNEVEDGNSITWLMTGVSIEVEKVEEPMTWERAVEILNAMAEEANEEQSEAIEFVLAHVGTLNSTITMLRQRMGEQQQQIASLLERVSALEAAQNAAPAA